MSKPYMKIVYKDEYGNSTVTKFKNELGDLNEGEWMLINFKQFMLAAGFHPDVIKEFLNS
jgi:hypothetical protein